MTIRIGVVALQGAVSEHLQALEKAGAEVTPVKKLEQLHGLNGIVIPGGESTTIGWLMQQTGLLKAVQQKAREGMAVWGTCAGLVLLAKKGGAQAKATGQPLLKLMSYEAERNAFGRQRESFEEEILVKEVGRIKGVFIRAPAIKRTWGNCRPIASLKGIIVAAKQEKMLATAFHPELTSDLKLHKYFLKIAKE